MVSTSEKTYFGKTILFILFSTIIFLVFKSILPSRLFPEKVNVTENIVMDSLALVAQNDTLVVADIINESDSVEVVGGNEVEINSELESDSVVNPSLNTDGYQNMSRFYAKLYELEQTKSGRVRIAYFGDSMNDGDFIVQDVRSHFQGDYGGQGVGYVAISSLSAGARGSVSHQFSKNWTVQTFVKNKHPFKPFGIDGQVFFANDSKQASWVKYKAQGQPHATALNSPMLFYGRSQNENGTVTIKADKNADEIKPLEPSNMLNTLRITSGDVRSLQVDFHGADSIPIYGFNFDDGQGVHVDNFSIRGNSGLPLSVLNPSLMNAFDHVLNYDLIVLHYGANVLGYGSLNYNWYEKNMTVVVNNLRQCFPNADVLVISTADKSSKIDGVMQTDSAVVPLAKAQKHYALKTKSGYIGLYELMGGKGSMVTWVDNHLAGKDYTHFNAAGSKKVAGLIYTEIMNGYNQYKANRNQ